MLAQSITDRSVLDHLANEKSRIDQAESFRSALTDLVDSAREPGLMYIVESIRTVGDILQNL